MLRPTTPISLLPAELLIDVLGRLDTRSVRSCITVCRGWQAVLRRSPSLAQRYRFPLKYCAYEDRRRLPQQLDGEQRQGRLVTKACIRYSASAFAVNPASKTMFRGTPGGDIIVSDASTGAFIMQWSAHSDFINELVVDATGRLWSCSDDATIKAWSSEGTQLAVCLEPLACPVNCITVAERFGVVFSGDAAGCVDAFDLETGAHKLTVHEAHPEPIEAVAVTDIGFCSASLDRTVKVFKHTGELVHTLRGHTRGVLTVVASGEKIVSAGGDRAILVWNAASGRCLFSLLGHHDAVFKLVLAGDRLFSGSSDATVKVWWCGQNDGQLVHTLTNHHETVAGLSFPKVPSSSNVSRHLWTLDDAGIVLRW